MVMAANSESLKAVVLAMLAETDDIANEIDTFSMPPESTVRPTFPFVGKTGLESGVRLRQENLADADEVLAPPVSQDQGTRRVADAEAAGALLELAMYLSRVG